MTHKAQLQMLLADCPEDVSYDFVIEKICFLMRIEEGLAQADRNEVIEDHLVWQRLLGVSALVA